MLVVSPAFSEALARGRQHLGRRPVVLLTIACLLGIVWADWAAPPVAPLLALSLLAVGLGLYAVLRELPAANFFLLLALFLLGALLHAWRITPGPTDLPPSWAHDLPQVEATVVAANQSTSFRQNVTLSGLTTGGRPVVRQAQVLLPPEPTVHLADHLTLSGVSLWPPRPAGTPGELDSARALARQGLFAQGQAGQIVRVTESPSAARSSQDWRVKQRARMLQALVAATPGADPQTYAALLASMVYGMRAAPVSQPVSDLFRNSGTIHLLVASGTQVSIIAFSLIFLVRGTRRVLPVWGMFVVIVGLVALALIAGLGASINRAVAMAVILLGSFAAGRRYDFPTALALSAQALCVLNTSTVFDIGAQLTYACSVGVFLAVPRPQGDRRNGLLNTLSLVCWGTLGASLFASPVIVSHFHRLVLLGGLANLVAVPLSVALLYLGMAAIALAMIWAPLATPVCALSRVLLGVILHVDGWCAALPGAGADNVYLPPLLLIGWYGLVALLFWARNSKTPRELARAVDWRATGPVAVCVIGVGVLVVALGGSPSHTLRMDVIDVGAAQCILVRAPGGHNLLLDAGTEVVGSGGGQSADRKVLPFLALEGVRSLDAIVLSHPHEDHCNLAAQIMQAIPTQRLLVGPEAGAEASWPTVRQVAATRGVPVEPAWGGATLRLAPGCAVEFLEPRSLLAGTADDANNNCLVERLVYGQTKVLLPADLQSEGEQRLLQDFNNQPEALQADVLVAAHHGSVHSDTPPFVAAVAPKVVVISCGSGQRRPRPQALQVFEERHLPIWRTDVSGTIEVSTDGSRVRVRGGRG